ncbi:DNA pilot protein [Blackfly microvirus SF02]|uniref:DNA pilot protein n=1 Tax=Blackfly microvirus SF02 TaxID=2576452 RepID=A0A4P8PTE0_9VIRU|nr:DNA pilot protein [Blackfly microvirus SF02]
MSLFSGIKKAANIAFNPSTWVSTAKDFLGSETGGLAAEAVGTYFGYPGAGSMLTKMAGGDWSGAASSALDMYKGYQAQNQTDQQYRQAYEQQLGLLAAQNSSARSLAEGANAMSQQNAREQMAWQKNMSDTAHQREVADLRAAGLNPILSGSGGMGASSSGGAQGSVSVAPVADTSRVASSAADIVRTLADTSKINAAKDLLQAQTITEAKRPAQIEQDTNLKRNGAILQATLQQTNLQTRNKIVQETKNLEATLNNIQLTGKQTAAQTAQIKQATENLKQTFRTLTVEAGLNEADAAYWQNLVGGASGSVKGSLEALKALKMLLSK